jgi:hypothetical protein
MLMYFSKNLIKVVGPKVKSGIYIKVNKEHAKPLFVNSSRYFIASLGLTVLTFRKWQFSVTPGVLKVLGLAPTLTIK